MLSVDTAWDFLSAIEFGCVDDAQPRAAWRFVGESFAYLTEPGSGRGIGFRVAGFSEFDPEAPEYEAIWWDEPRFDVPLLGCFDATAGEICLAARAFLDEEPTLNRCYFASAVAASSADDDVEAARNFQLCLESGDLMGHYGLGYTLYALGDFHGAHRHLTAYSKIAPRDAWTWCWLGKACLALDQEAEARAALERATEFEQDGDETDAGELLAEIEGRGSAR